MIRNALTVCDSYTVTSRDLPDTKPEGCEHMYQVNPEWPWYKYSLIYIAIHLGMPT